MITLYTFGPHFGLPDGSPFVTKTMLLLKFAGLPYQETRQGRLRPRTERQAASGAEGCGLGDRENVRRAPLFGPVGNALAR
jgi:hypothetical protein